MKFSQNHNLNSNVLCYAAFHWMHDFYHHEYAPAYNAFETKSTAVSLPVFHVHDYQGVWSRVKWNLLHIDYFCGQYRSSDPGEASCYWSWRYHASCMHYDELVHLRILPFTLQIWKCERFIPRVRKSQCCERITTIKNILFCIREEEESPDCF